MASPAQPDAAFARVHRFAGALAAMFSPRSPRPALCWYTQRSAHACATAAASEDQLSGKPTSCPAGGRPGRPADCGSGRGRC